ncbi:Eco57I restriction-modification methylase domain-containing protein [Clostridium tyrobutyricum]|uniref:Eco57I restriction-modification methylase domain-containing protein n=1 Tax=Clostridium tyrobutyricum TaxID=1519 RepID=UPI001C38EDAD|nr:Eco57I restriction-modification methylase domain-containing protein [Clostridium tyrobutyricum]MBV4420530.1 Eco57I restriction-modification methylase domain-containing protein [Clostridium tyrobutyricum]
MVSSKLKLLKETFESKFNIDKFKRFTLEFFNEPKMLSAKCHIGIWKEYENNILSYSDIAKFNDAEENKIIILAVELKSGKGVERARSLQRNFISKILDKQGCEAAIVAFYSEHDVNWRLSFVRLDYTFKDKGLELDLTPAKRYSYLVGENETSHTAQKQLYPIFEDDKHNPTLDEIEIAFSVEKVTKDFFEQYKNKYFDLKEYLEKDESFINETLALGFEVDKFSEQFAKKLMGQLAFLYFLQKKGWLGVRIMPQNHRIEKAQFTKIYNAVNDEHKEILKKIFINEKDGTMKLSIKVFYSITDEEADLLSDCFINSELNMPWGSGNKKFIRGIYNFCMKNENKNFFDDYLEPFFYEALNKRRKNQYYKYFNCKIPFLNGGLFEPLEGYHWKKAKFRIPNNIFSNIDENARKADGILDIFDRYNFTMNEDEPLEKEVAVDPEMLGKIFENLLDGKDRKSKGAFYTPREIVHYMCQESLTNYLVNRVNVPYEDMMEFIIYGELIRDADNRYEVSNNKSFKDKKTIKQTIFDNIVYIDEALKNISIADPAVGSGAFPLGMLNEIVRARNNITEYIIKKDKEGIFERTYGEKFIRKHRSQYKMKWDTIKNCIFAVDIEPSAVDIAKLRLWLSVVVEQEIDDENPEPHPLPNLDCNIMVGNSLIDEYEGIKLFDESLLHKYRNNNSREKSEKRTQIASVVQMNLLIDQSDDMLKEMFDLQDRLFDEDDEHKKKEIKYKIDKIRDSLIEYKLNRDGNKGGLKKYNEMKKLKMKPFFIWELEFAKVFKEKGGFDIVIGNPPYVDSEEMVRTMSELRKNLSKKYSTTKGNWDLYIPFWEKAYNLINSMGNATLITPNKWLAIKYGEALRNCLFDKIYNITDYSTFKAFETADVSTVVVFVCNILSQKINVIKFNSEFSIDSRHTVYKSKIKELDNLSLCLSNSYSTLEKIINNDTLNKYFILEEAATVSETYKIANYLLDCIDEDTSKYFKFINTGTIDKYRSLWGIAQMTYVKRKYIKPVILKNDVESNFKRRYKQALSPKIITTGIRYFECYLDDSGEYLAAKSTVIIREKSNFKLCTVLPILNSNLVYYFLKEAYSGLAMGGGVNFTANNLSKIPIPNINEQQIQRLNMYSNIMQSYYFNKKSINTSNVNPLEMFEEIDEFVYSLYSLNEQDIKILNEFKYKNKRKR